MVLESLSRLKMVPRIIFQGGIIMMPLCKLQLFKTRVKYGWEEPKTDSWNRDKLKYIYISEKLFYLILFSKFSTRILSSKTGSVEMSVVSQLSKSSSSTSIISEVFNLHPIFTWHWKSFISCLFRTLFWQFSDIIPSPLSSRVSNEVSKTPDLVSLSVVVKTFFCVKIDWTKQEYYLHKLRIFKIIQVITSAFESILWYKHIYLLEIWGQHFPIKWLLFRVIIIAFERWTDRQN